MGMVKEFKEFALKGNVLDLVSTERGSHGLCFGDIIHTSRRAMQIDVVDVVRHNVRSAQHVTDQPSETRTIRFHLSDAARIVRHSTAHELGVDRGSTCLSRFELLQDEHCRPFTDHESRAIGSEGPTCRRGIMKSPSHNSKPLKRRENDRH